MIIPLHWENTFTNVLYVCPKMETNKRIYSDDLNTATLDYFKSMHKLLH